MLCAGSGHAALKGMREKCQKETSAHGVYALGALVYENYGHPNQLCPR